MYNVPFTTQRVSRKSSYFNRTVPFSSVTFSSVVNCRGTSIFWFCVKLLGRIQFSSITTNLRGLNFFQRIQIKPEERKVTSVPRGKSSQSGGPRLLSPFIAALKTTCFAKNGGHGYPACQSPRESKNEDRGKELRPHFLSPVLHPLTRRGSGTQGRAWPTPSGVGPLCHLHQITKFFILCVYAELELVHSIVEPALNFLINLKLHESKEGIYPDKNNFYNVFLS